MLETLWHDAHYAARTLAKAPLFTGAVVLTLAIGIGANSAIFSLLNAVTFRTLPIPAPQELVRVYQSLPPLAGDAAATSSRMDLFSYPAFVGLRDSLPGGASVAAVSAGIARFNLRFASDTTLTPVTAQLVTGRFFSTLGVQPAAGRLLNDTDDETIGAHQVVVLRNGFAVQRYGNAASAVGHTIPINGVPFTIVGVSQNNFPGITIGQVVDLWIPAVMQHAVGYRMNVATHGAEADDPWIPQSGVEWLHVILRSPEATRAHAQAAMAVVYRNHARAEGQRRGDNAEARQLLASELDIESFAGGFSDVREEFSRPLTFLMAMVALLLLIGCVNIANLLLARGTARHREIGVRLSLGAGRGRVVQQLLTESALLALLATGLALALCQWAGVAMAALAGVQGALPRGFAFDSRVVMFTSLMGFSTLILFGVMPAMRVTSVDPAETLRWGNGRVAGSTASMRPLVVGQIALSIVLVASAGLFARSLFNLWSVDPGFDRTQLVSIPLSTQDTTAFDGEQMMALREHVLDRVGRVPGVVAADVSYTGTASGSRWRSGMNVEGYTPGPNERVVFQENSIGPDYFRSTGMTLREGRALSERDVRNAPAVAVVNETAVRHYFNGRSPIGKRLGYDELNTEIVGVVQDARVDGLREAPPPMVFYPLAQRTEFAAYLDVRTNGDPASVGAAARRSILDVDSRVRIGTPTPIADALDRGINRDYLVAAVAVTFGLIALLLASIGVYGVMAYGVARRVREMGVRAAVGATPTDLRRLVIADGMRVVVAGAVIGLGFALATARLLEALLFGITPTDPATHAAVVGALLVVGFAACSVPAWRAARVDPVTAIRPE